VRSHFVDGRWSISSLELSLSSSTRAFLLNHRMFLLTTGPGSLGSATAGSTKLRTNALTDAMTMFVYPFPTAHAHPPPNTSTTSTRSTAFFSVLPRINALLSCFVRCVPTMERLRSEGNTLVADSPVRPCKAAKMMQRCVSSRHFFYSPFFFHYRTFIVVTRSIDPQPLASSSQITIYECFSMIGNASICFKNPCTAWGLGETTPGSFLHPTVACSPKRRLRIFHGVTLAIHSLKCSENNRKTGLTDL
jgi:hypothetical protein